MFEPFQHLVKRAAGHFGVSKEVEAAQVCEICRKVLREMMGEHENLVSFIWPAYFRDGVLMVNVSDATWSQEVLMRREKIVAEINKRYEKEIVKTMQMQMGRREY